MDDNTENKPVLTESFVPNFQCIGSRCEYHCCQGWAVNVEKPVFKNLKKRYGNLAGQKKLVASLKKNSNPESDWAYGRIQLNDKLQCPFLTPENLCDIHQRFGDNQLSWVCQHFPRSLVDGLEFIELSVSLGCPEAARLCLLEENSTGLITTSRQIVSGLPGPLTNYSLRQNQQPAYLEVRDDIRQVLLFLADARQYPLGGRLFLMLYFAELVKENFHASSKSLLINETIKNAIDKIANPDVHLSLVKGIYGMDYEPTAFIVIISTILANTSARIPALNQLVNDCLSANKIDINAPEEPAKYETIYRAYTDKKLMLESLFAERLDLYFNNYVKHNLFYKSYVTFPSLMGYLRNLLIQINVIKFLFVLHPLLSEDNLKIDKDSDNPESAGDILDKAIVNAISVCARAFDHQNENISEKFDKVLDENNFKTIEQLAMLARL